MNDFFIACQESRIESPRSFYGCFYIGPFNSNQSLTVANALRRTLLSELSGIAITSVEIEGAVHEYSTLPGIRDSVLDILLNLKQIVLKSFFTNTIETKKNFAHPLIGYLQARGPGIVRAADLKLPASIQCVDPDQYIASLSADGFLNMKFMIHRGKNYIIQNPKYYTYKKKQSAEIRFSNSVRFNAINPAKINEQKNIKNIEKKISTTPLHIDSVFMPIVKVNYIIENQSVQNSSAMSYTQNFLRKDSRNIAMPRASSIGADDFADQKITKKTMTANEANYENPFSNNIVVLEVWTNGSIHPRQAVYDALKKLTCLFSQLEKMKILSSSLATELLKSNENSAKIFKKIEYEYDYYTDMEQVFKTSKTETQLSPDSFLEAQKQLEKKYKLEIYNEKQLKKIPISNLNISNRSRMLLENSRIYNIADLVNYQNTKLTNIKGFGKKCLQEVKNALEKIGLDFISEKCN